MNNTDVDLFFEAFIEIDVYHTYCKKKTDLARSTCFQSNISNTAKLSYPDVLFVCLCDLFSILLLYNVNIFLHQAFLFFLSCIQVIFFFRKSEVLIQENLFPH